MVPFFRWRIPSFSGFGVQFHPQVSASTPAAFTAGWQRYSFACCTSQPILMGCITLGPGRMFALIYRVLGLGAGCYSPFFVVLFGEGCLVGHSAQVGRSPPPPSQHRRFRWQKAEEHEPRQNPRLRRWGLVLKMEEFWRIGFLEPVIFLVELNQWR